MLKKGVEVVKREGPEVPDDVLKHPVYSTEGSHTNIKVTTHLILLDGLNLGTGLSKRNARVEGEMCFLTPKVISHWTRQADRDRYKQPFFSENNINYSITD